MSTRYYTEAVALIRENDLSFLDPMPQDAKEIERLEQALKVPLTNSYRLMLSQFGILMIKGGEIIYGMGLTPFDEPGGSGVYFQTMIARERKSISNTMIRIMSSGYGPQYCIETAEINKKQEAPVYLVPGDGDLSNAKLVAPSFDVFLLDEVKAALDNQD